MRPELHGPRSGESGGGKSMLGRMLRGLLWALAIAFLVGFLIGSLLRRELERPVRYIGEHRDATTIYDASMLYDSKRLHAATTIWNDPTSRSDPERAAIPRPTVRQVADMRRRDAKSCARLATAPSQTDTKSRII